MRQIAQNLAEQDGARKAQAYPENNTSMTADDINEARDSGNATSFDDLAEAEIEESDNISAGYQALKEAGSKLYNFLFGD